MAVWFTSDTHFGHDAIIGFMDRPFGTAEEMDAVLIANWNAAIAPGDVVYHLGDFSYRNARPATAYLDALNGDVHLIAGNHDGATLKDHANRFASVSEIKEMSVSGQTLVLCHYPMREWVGAWRGAWHLFGHVHGRLDHEPVGYSLDVGVDTHGFRPWSFEEIAAVMETRVNPFTDDHPRRIRKTIRAP